MSIEERKTILLVETEGSIAAGLEKTLKQQGFGLIVKSPEEANLSKVKDTNIDLILVGMDGDEDSFATRTAMTFAQNRDLPLVCLTATTDAESISRIEKVTDYGYIATSWSDDFLIATLKHALLLFAARREGKRKDRELKSVQWMLSKKVKPSLKSLEHQDEYIPKYGDLTSLNEDGLILTSVGKDVLRKIASEFYDLLDTSAAIYEKDGRYALGLFASSWCQFMDQASRDLCNTEDNREALTCGKWLCHESCWQKASLQAINTGKSADIACVGGIHLYATPIHSGDEIIGAINFGYGDPPRDRATLKKLALKYNVSFQELSERAHSYKSRPNFIIELAKQRLEVSAALIGEIVERKQIQQALQESERNYREIFDNSLNGLCLFKMLFDEEGKPIDCEYIKVNKSFESNTGLTPGRIIGKTLRKVYPEAEADEILSFYHSALTSGETVSKDIFFKPTNSWFELGVIPMRDDLFTVIINNITSRKEAGRKQSLSSEILAVLNSATSQSSSLKQVLTAIKVHSGFDAVGIRLKREDDYPYYVQQGFPEDFIIKENSLLSNDDKGFCRDENGRPSLECTCGVVVSGKTDPNNPLFTSFGSSWTNNSLPILDVPEEDDPRYNPRNRCIHDGYMSVALIPLRANDEIVGLLQLNDKRKDRFTPEMIEFYEELCEIIGIALTRQEAERKLKESEIEYQHISKELESILDHIPGLIFYKDKENNFIRVNKYGADAYQKTKRDLEGVNISELHSQEIAEQYLQDDLKVINSGVAKLNIEEQWVTTDGLKWLSTSKIPFVNDTGQVIGIIGISIDISKRKQAELNLKQTQDKLMNLERKNAVLAMIVTANHEINQPLTVLRGNLELLERKLKEKGYEKYFSAMEQSLTRIDNILAKLRDLDEIKLKKYTGNTPMLDI